MFWQVENRNFSEAYDIPIFNVHFKRNFVLFFRIKNGDDDAKSKVLDIAKRRVVHQYYRKYCSAFTRKLKLDIFLN